MSLHQTVPRPAQQNLNCLWQWKILYSIHIVTTCKSERIGEDYWRMLLPLFVWFTFDICDWFYFIISLFFLTLSPLSLRPLALFLPSNFLSTCPIEKTPPNVYACWWICTGCKCVHVCACVCLYVCLFCSRMWSALVEVNQRNPRAQRSNSIVFIDQATFSASVPSLCSLKLSASHSFLGLSISLPVCVCGCVFELLNLIYREFWNT